MPDLHALVVVTVPRPWHDARNASNVMRQVLVVLMMWLPSLGCDRAVHVRQSGHDPQNRVEIGAFVPRDLETVPSNEHGALIRIGYQLVTRTQDTVKAFVGNGLNCTNCHLAAGQKIGAAAFVGLSRIYPEYRSRNARVNTLEDRLDDCFARSMNGTPLPAGSREKAALVTYIEWLSEGVTQEEALRWRGFFRLPSTGIPDVKRGALLYETRCSGCHGVDGQGTPLAPPVWGPRSYNIGAGMARVSLAAAFIKHNMPLGQGGTLSDDEVYDVAAYLTQQPRPDFPRKHLDWPNGGKPKDAPY